MIVELTTGVLNLGGGRKTCSVTVQDTESLLDLVLLTGRKVWYKAVSNHPVF